MAFVIIIHTGWYGGQQNFYRLFAKLASNRSFRAEITTKSIALVVDKFLPA